MTDELSDLVQVAVVSMLPLQFGLHMGILNAPMDYMGCKGVEGESQDCIPGWSPAIPSSIYALGGLLGSAISGPVINKYGLRKVFFLYAGIFVIGSLLVSSATSVNQIIFGRLVTGTAAGGSIVVSPIMINELSPPRFQSSLGTCTQLTTNFGIVVAQLLGMFLAETHWRRIMWSAFLIAIAVFVASYFIIYQQDASAEHHPVSQSGAEPASEQPRISIGMLDLFTQPHYRYTLITATSIFAVQQLTGINSIIQYGVRIMADVMPNHAKSFNMLLSGHNLVMTLIIAPFMDKCSRKKLLLISLGSMSVCTAALAFGLVRGLAGFSVAAAFCTIAAFAIGIGPIPFMYVSEFSPKEAVSAAQSLGTVSSWISTFAVLAFFPSMQSALGSSVFYVFSACTLAAALVYWKWLV